MGDDERTSKCGATWVARKSVAVVVLPGIVLEPYICLGGLDSTAIGCSRSQIVQLDPWYTLRLLEVFFGTLQSEDAVTYTVMLGA
jgi:hypothetical protein